MSANPNTVVHAAEEYGYPDEKQPQEQARGSKGAEPGVAKGMVSAPPRTTNRLFDGRTEWIVGVGSLYTGAHANWNQIYSSAKAFITSLKTQHYKIARRYRC